MNRTFFLRSLIDVDGVGLEIGPSYNPLLPKRDGFSVKTVDYTDAAGLRQKYAGNSSVDPATIEDVDYVLDGGKSLAEAIGDTKCYDYIMASHVIEHVPNLLSFLQSCEALLKATGVLLLAVPDKRHCFDVLQPLSTTGTVLQAHLDNHTRPTPGSVFDDRAYNAVRDGAIGWPIGADGELAFFAGLDDAAAGFKQAQQPGYIDVHVWRFVPSSCRLIMRDLSEIDAMRLREKTFHDSVGNEFYMSLSASAAGCPVDRLTLALDAMKELAVVKV